MNEEQDDDIKQFLDALLDKLTEKEARKALRDIAQCMLPETRELFSSVEILVDIAEIFSELEKK